MAFGIQPRLKIPAGPKELLEHKTRVQISVKSFRN